MRYWFAVLRTPIKYSELSGDNTPLADEYTIHNHLFSSFLASNIQAGGKVAHGGENLNHLFALKLKKRKIYRHLVDCFEWLYQNCEQVSKTFIVTDTSK